MTVLWMVLPLLFSSAAGPAGMEKPLTIVAFGTSHTARGGWQQALEDGLARCLKTSVSVETVARSGATSDWALTALDQVVALRPAIVLIEFYSNDAAVNRWMSVSHSRANFETIIRRLRKKLPDSRIIMTVMNPISGIRGMIRPFLNSYIDAQREAALALGAEFLDYRPAWSKLSDQALDQAIPDGAHAKPEVAISVMLPELLPKLAGRPCAM